MKLNKGDIVRPFDGSGSLGIDDNGKFYRRYGIDLKQHLFEVVAVDCKLPAENSVPDMCNSKRYVNDIILRDIETGEIVFSMSRSIHVEKTNRENVVEVEFEKLERQLQNLKSALEN